MASQYLVTGRRRAPGFERLLLLALVLMLGACAAKGRGAVPPGTMQPDQFLFERGNALLKEKKWLTAREFFKQLTETYTQSPHRPDAKLAIGDTYLGEGNTEALVLAQNEFREFLSFYPTNPRADYAQYKIAMTYFRQMRAPQRDQTETRDTIRELQILVARYPNSQLMPEVKAKLREAKDRLSEADYQVGVFYYRQRWFPGAIDRLSTLIKTDPEYTTRDGAYFYLGEALVKVGRPAEALPYFERLVAEFQQSEHLEDTHKRIETLKSANAGNAKLPASKPAAGAAAPAVATSGTAPAHTPAPPATPAATPVGEGGQSAAGTPVVSPR
ncbi:MAG: outer membrane protein assembly factor BamD [Acidimicrobiia bacterium]|nr:outer membrane protein assembly factor BamD [Acidimicrobiia bacterium]